MDNVQIADAFSLLSKLMDIHGENSFKTRSYAFAARTIEMLPVELADLPREKIFSIKGIGDAIGEKIVALIETGSMPILSKYVEKTPPGVIEMLRIKGLGPKKISVIWKDMGLETIGELLYACNENRLLLFKGFGEKTQQNVRKNIEFYLRNKGSYLYAEIETEALHILQLMEKQFPNHRFSPTGDFLRQMETVDKLEYVISINEKELESFLTLISCTVTQRDASAIQARTTDNLTIVFHLAQKENFGNVLFTTGGSAEFLDAWEQRFPLSKEYPDEKEIFEAAGVPFIPHCAREKESIIEKYSAESPGPFITTKEIKGIIHSHSNWSDGRQSIEEMAKEAIQRGFEYLVLSDHSKSAFYANGLREERIREQHLQVDALNKQFAPFKIFKSIESDILNDGELDYSPDVLASFDLVISSIHSNLKMNEEKAMSRLLSAIENPYTTILGHMTGRLLLTREGYPVDHKRIIDACVSHHVAIELNAHPRRLDIDWRWIGYALDKGVLISINPDAHHTDGYQDIRYGVLVAQKAGLTSKQNLSSFTRKEFEDYLHKKKKAKGI